MSPLLESDVDVDGTVAPGGEAEVGHLAPQGEGGADLRVHQLPRQLAGLRVLGDAVGEVEGPPPAVQQLL